MDRYIRALLDPFVTLLEVHKLMYFMQLAGESLRLNYAKAPYGPYAENMRHVLKEIEGHLISGYADGGDAPGKQLELIPGGRPRTQRRSSRITTATKKRMDRVADLVAGFESAFGLELLATVHWAAAEHPSTAEDELIERVYAWDPQKRQFSARPERPGAARAAREGLARRRPLAFEVAVGGEGCTDAVADGRWRAGGPRTS